MVADIQREAKARKKTEKHSLQAARHALTDAIQHEGIQALEVHQHGPPFPVHGTHALVTCGGYWGCIRCAFYSGFCKENKHLQQWCRRGHRGPRELSGD